MDKNGKITFQNFLKFNEIFFSLAFFKNGKNEIAKLIILLLELMSFLIHFS